MLNIDWLQILQSKDSMLLIIMSYLKLNWIFLYYGLLVEQNKRLEDINLGYKKFKSVFISQFSDLL